jgi:hypothetical protein
VRGRKREGLERRIDEGIRFLGVWEGSQRVHSRWVFLGFGDWTANAVKCPQVSVPEVGKSEVYRVNT